MAKFYSAKKRADELINKATRLNRYQLVLIVVIVPTQAYTALWVEISVIHTVGAAIAAIWLSKFISRTCNECCEEALAHCTIMLNIRMKEANEV